MSATGHSHIFRGWVLPILTLSQHCDLFLNNCRSSLDPKCLFNRHIQGLQPLHLYQSEDLVAIPTHIDRLCEPHPALQSAHSSKFGKLLGILLYLPTSFCRCFRSSSSFCYALFRKQDPYSISRNSLYLIYSESKDLSSSILLHHACASPAKLCTIRWTCSCYGMKKSSNNFSIVVRTKIFLCNLMLF